MDGERPGAEAQAIARRMGALLNGYQLSAAIGAVARLGVADALAGAPASTGEIARAVGADERSLARILELLAAAGVVERDGDGRFSLTALGELLRSDVPGSVRRAAIVATEEWHWRPYGALTEAVRRGEAAFPLAHGCGFWEYLARHPDAGALVGEGMAHVASFTAAAFASAYDLGDARLLVDVGAGRGVLLRAALEAYPHLRGIAVDLPEVAAEAQEALAEAGLADRCETVGADFFDGVPPGGDVYVLSWVLHDWDDASALRILRNCRAALAPGGRVVAIELLAPEAGAPSSPDTERLVRTADVEMLVLTGGRERTLPEYRALYGDAGLELTRVVPLEPLAWSVLEGTAARSAA